MSYLVGLPLARMRLTCGFGAVDVCTEMQKVADRADISVLFFSAGANFWAILGHFWAILGHFWAIFWQNMHLCYLNRFLQL